MLKSFVWHVNYKLDRSLIREGLKKLEGRHDFKNFSSGHEGKKETKIVIQEAGCLMRDDNLIIISIKAEYFLTYMICYLVGFIDAVASGKETLDKLEKLLKGDGELSDYCAPPRGLELTEIKYR